MSEPFMVYREPGKTDIEPVVVKQRRSMSFRQVGFLMLMGSTLMPISYLISLGSLIGWTVYGTLWLLLWGLIGFFKDPVCYDCSSRRYAWGWTQMVYQNSNKNIYTRWRCERCSVVAWKKEYSSE